MTLLFDMDDVIEDLLHPWLAWLNKKYGTDVQYDQVDEWNLHKYFPGLEKEQLYEPLYTEEFWDDVKPLENAQIVIQRLLEEGHRVFIVTSSDYRTVKPKMERVLFRYFPFLTWDNVVITGHKELIHGDVLVDDGLHNLMGGDYIKVLMDAPYNRNQEEAKYVDYTVFGWGGIYNLIHDLKRKEIEMLSDKLEANLSKAGDI